MNNILLLSAADLYSLLGGYAHRLLEKNMYACLHCVDSANGVGTVVGTNGNGIKLKSLVSQHLLVGSVVGLNTLNAVLLEESLSLSGDEVCACDDLNVGHLLVGSDVRICYPSGSDYTDTELSGGVYCCRRAVCGIRILGKSHGDYLLFKYVHFISSITL